MTTTSSCSVNGIESFWTLPKPGSSSFIGVPKHTLLLHLKESEFRVTHRYEDLYKLLLKFLRQQHL
jgi:transposase